MFVLTDWCLARSGRWEDPLEILRAIEFPLTLLCLELVLISLFQDGLIKHFTTATGLAFQGFNDEHWSHLRDRTCSMVFPLAKSLNV